MGHPTSFVQGISGAASRSATEGLPAVGKWADATHLVVERRGRSGSGSKEENSTLEARVEHAIRFRELACRYLAGSGGAGGRQ